MKKTALLLALSSTLILSGPASFALDRGGKVEIKGKVSQTVKADNVFNIGIGENVRAIQRIATIGGGDVKIGGDVMQDVKVENAFNIGIGSKVTACQQIASIGDSGC